MKNPNQPREYDAVKGGQVPTPIDGVILGGLEGVKKRWASSFEDQRIAALSDALKYEEAGLDLVIQALQDESGYVRVTAYSLLQERAEPRVKQALIETVKKYLASPDINCKIDALKEAIKYGNEGLDLVIQALQDESEQVETAAYLLLREREEPRVKYVLQQHNPWGFFDCLCTLKEHLGLVNSVAISSDGIILFSDSSVQSIVWILTTGFLLKVINKAHSNLGISAISPDGKTVVSDSLDKTIKAWDWQTGLVLHTLEKNAMWVCSLAISPDGKMVATCSYGGNIKVWDLQTNSLLRNLECNSRCINSVVISLDGKTIVTGNSDNTITVWDLQTGGLLHTLKGHSSEVNSVAISLDSKKLVSGSSDNTITIWDLQTGCLLHSLNGHSHSVNSITISPDNKTIISGSSDHTIKIWNLQTGRILCTLDGHSRSVNSVAISLDGKTIVSSSSDETIKVWGVR